MSGGTTGGMSVSMHATMQMIQSKNKKRKERKKRRRDMSSKRRKKGKSPLSNLYPLKAQEGRT
jgi:hypothetical protein